MAIIVPPAPLPVRGVRWRKLVPAQVNRSGWTNRRKVIGLPGATMWTASGELVPVIGARNGARWRGFFMALEGPINRFRLSAVEARQTAAANPTIAAGSTDGTTLPLAGLPANQTVLTYGMMMTVALPSGHERLVCLDQDLVTGPTGTATASFGPELGEVPVVGSVVEIRDPWGLMALTSDPTGWDVEPGQQYSFAFQAEEAL